MNPSSKLGFGRRTVCRDRNGIVSTRAHRQRLLRYDVAPSRRRLVRPCRDFGGAGWRQVLAAARPKNPASAAMNIYKSSDDVWFLLVVTPDKIPAVLEGIGHSDLLKRAAKT